MVCFDFSINFYTLPPSKLKVIQVFLPPRRQGAKNYLFEA
jgi:hypothetical protein